MKMMAQSQVKGFLFPLEFMKHKIKVSKIQHIYRDSYWITSDNELCRGKSIFSFSFLCSKVIRLIPLVLASVWQVQTCRIPSTLVIVEIIKSLKSAQYFIISEDFYTVIISLGFLQQLSKEKGWGLLFPHLMGTSLSFCLNIY